MEKDDAENRLFPYINDSSPSTSPSPPSPSPFPITYTIIRIHRVVLTLCSSLGGEQGAGQGQGVRGRGGNTEPLVTPLHELLGPTLAATFSMATQTLYEESRNGRERRGERTGGKEGRDSRTRDGSYGGREEAESM